MDNVAGRVNSASSQSQDPPVETSTLDRKPRPRGEASRAPQRILIVDDDEDTCLIFTVILRKEGYETSLAKDGVEAMQRIEQLRPDLVLLDIRIPGPNGLEVCRMIKGSPLFSSSPVLIISAAIACTPMLREQALNAGAEEVLSKPINPCDLLTKIKINFSRYESSRPSL